MTRARAGARQDLAPVGVRPRFGEWLQARLRRKTTSARFIPEVDGLRLVAIALVVLFHVGVYVAVRQGFAPSAPAHSWLGRIAVQGKHGVQLFFILSGFILGVPFAAHRLAGGTKVDLRRYFLRRVTRLEPPYLLAMLGLAALLVMTGRYPAGTVLPHLAASLGYVHNLVYGRESLVNSVAWSLEVEIQFYLLAPLLAAALFRIRSPALRRSIIVALAAAMAALQLTAVRGWTPNLLQALQYFLAGYLLADLYVTDWARSPAGGRGWDVAWFAGWPLLLWSLEAPYAVAVFAFPAVAAMVVAASLRGKVGRWVLSRPWVTVPGGMCYSIYLLHYPVISAVERAAAGVIPMPSTVPAALLLHLALNAVPIALVCGAFYVLVERPCMDPRWPERAWRWMSAWFSRRTPAEVPARVAGQSR
ncbi:MAG TPA: acyltransferase [Longimicrobium sp.]|nr:acyltransferase [Longimicrobium sp.]